MNITETLRDIVEGIKALPACAEATRELVVFERESCQECERLREHVDALEFDVGRVTKERDSLQRKLEWLTRARLQSEEPCPFGSEELILIILDGEWRTCRVCYLSPTGRWRPLDLTHYAE